MKKSAAFFLSFVFIFFNFFAFFNISAQAEFSNANNIKSYKEIPGITEYEIDAIEALKAERNNFTYGHMITSEAFIMPDGNFTGFIISFCDFLSELFGIEFRHVNYGWNELLAAVDEKTVDFTSEVIPSVQTNQSYFKTNIIAYHALTVFLPDSSAIKLNTETDLNGLNVGFLIDSSIPELIRSTYPSLSYNSHPVDDYYDAAQQLKKGQIDVFITAAIANPFFNDYNFDTAKNLFSLIKLPTVMITPSEELEPIISVIEKYLAAGGIDELYSMYEESEAQYNIYELNHSFNEAELNYLKQKKAVPVWFDSSNYPISFYNEAEKEFQGIVVDILNEISKLTGITFKSSFTSDTKWNDVVSSLENGNISMISQFSKIDSRLGKFLFSEKPYATANYALISKADFPLVSTYRVPRINVGTFIGMASEERFFELFPFSSNTTGFFSFDDAIAALDSGKIDALMSSEYCLYTLMNYMGKTDYKVNILFEPPMNSYFGFNADENILCSIIDKAFNYVDAARIEYDWTSKIFDYAKQYEIERGKAILAFSVLLMFVLTILIILFIKNKRLNSNLEKIVQRRTHELETQAASLNRMSLIINNSPQYIAYINREGKYIYYNPATYAITGFSQEELNENGISILYDDETNKRIRDEIIPKIFELGKYEFEITITRKDGEKRKMKFSAFAIGSEDLSCGAIAMDITENKKLEKQLIEAKELALQNSRSKSEFLSHMSHEIRTPMNAIIGMTKIAKNSDSHERVNDCLEKIESASSQLLDVINHVLDMSKIEAGKFELSYMGFDIEKAILKIANVFQYRMEEKHIDFSVIIDKDIPQIIISDEQRLTQVITNLISNAFKFTSKHGKISTEVRKLSSDEKSCRLEFVVKDTGVGISKDAIGRIFLSYEQESNDFSKDYTGTGLGLSISKHIIDLMGGNIWVESELGRGSSFIFTINTAFEQETQKSSNDIQENENDYKGFFAGKHILLADDIEINCEIVLSILEPMGIEVDCASNGAEALAMFEEYPNYDLIFMDILMPELNGYEASRKIRALSEPKAKTVPIIAMTANVFKEDIERCIKEGMNDHIGKPLDFSSVIKKLKKYLK